jgi:hypothetical protein
MKITNWKNCIKNRSKWKEFVGKIKTSVKLQRLKKKKKKCSTGGISLAVLFCRGNFVASENCGGVSVRIYQDLLSQAVLTCACNESGPVAGVVLNCTVLSFRNSVRCLHMELL